MAPLTDYVTSEDYWDIDGIPLQSLAYNVASWGGSRQSPPPLRGSDIQVPFANGQYWVPKIPDSKTIQFGMWVQGCNPDGTAPTDASQLRVFRENWEMLKHLFWTPGRQMVLTRRWWDTRSGALLAATAKGEYAGGLEPTMTSPLRATFTVDVRLADPFFRGTPVTVNFDLTTNATQVITVPGDYATSLITLHAAGPLESPQWTLTDHDPAPYLRYAASLADGETADIDTGAWTATHTDTNGDHAVMGYIQHYGYWQWLQLAPRDNTLVFSAQSGTGISALTYTPVYA